MLIYHNTELGYVNIAFLIVNISAINSFLTKWIRCHYYSYKALESEFILNSLHSDFYRFAEMIQNKQKLFPSPHLLKPDWQAWQAESDSYCRPVRHLETYIICIRDGKITCRDDSQQTDTVNANWMVMVGVRNLVMSQKRRKDSTHYMRKMIRQYRGSKNVFALS